MTQPKPTPQTLLDAIHDRNRTLPYAQRPTRRETMAALIECVRLAVAERDATRRASPQGMR